MTKTIDFDAFRKEQAREGVSLTIGGRAYELPTALPAALALEIVRLHQTEGDDADPKPEDLMRIGAGLFGGEDIFKQVLTEAKVGLDELPDLIQMIVEEYTAGVGGDTKAGEAPTQP